MSEVAAQQNAVASPESNRTLRSRHSPNISEDFSACTGGAGFTNCPAGRKLSDLDTSLTKALAVDCAMNCPTGVPDARGYLDLRSGVRGGQEVLSAWAAVSSIRSHLFLHRRHGSCGF
jgi:hypothetical protein